MLFETVEEISSITRDSDRLIDSAVFGEYTNQEWLNSSRSTNDTTSTGILSSQANRAKTLDYAGATAQLHPSTNQVTRDLIYRAEAVQHEVMMSSQYTQNKTITPWFMQ